MTDVTLCTGTPAVFAFDSHAIRTVTEEDGTVWIVARDVCAALGIQSPERAFSRLDDDQKGMRIVHTPGGPQDMTVLNESGTYTLILRSNKSEAKQFARWVTGEVLPAIRRQGYYGGGALATMAQAVTQTQALLERMAENQARTDAKIDALLTLVDVYGKYTSLLETHQRKPRTPPRPVTRADEAEVLRLVAQGMNQADIARHIGISRPAVNMIANGKYPWREGQREGGAQ